MRGMSPAFTLARYNMQLEKTPIWAAARKIFDETDKPVKFEFTAKIHTTDEDFDALKVLKFDIIKDYVNSIGDVMMMELIMPLGDYMKRFYPYRTNMELTLFKKQQDEIGGSFKLNAGTDSERFKVVFLPDENPQVSGSDLETMDRETLNHMDVVTIKIQLLNRAMEPLRILTTGGIFKNVKNEDVIRSVLMSESNQVTIDGQKAIDGIDMVKSDNEETQRHVIIPQGTAITSVPSFCQDKMNGVYSAGIGTYMQAYEGKRYWFVYPLYNPKRFKENRKKVIFYAIPSNRMPITERSYRVSGDILYVAITSTKSYKDHGETEYMNNGSGFRMADARAFLKKPIKMTVDGPVGIQERLNFAVAVKERLDNLNFAPLSSSKISSNPFSEYSKVSSRTGGRLDLVWHHANASLLYPGMPCQYVFMEDDVLRIKEGVVLFCHSATTLQGPIFSGRSHETTCQLTLFVEQADS